MLDLTRLLDKSRRLQWSTGDVDWDAPGADRVGPDQARDLASFMADLYWIETIASVVFDAMAQRETDTTRRAIFESFSTDEARHAEAERLLMVRWGILGKGARPVPNPNVRRLLATLERSATKVHPSVFSAIVPMTELVLDGALVKYLVRVVDDPICHRVFEGINADEARHLAMDFHMLEYYGREQSRTENTIDLLRSFVRPSGLYAMFFGYLPMLARSRGNLERMGMDLDEAGRAMRRYCELGEKNADIAKHPTYVLMRGYVESVTQGKTQLGDWLVRASDVLEGMSVRRAA